MPLSAERKFVFAPEMKKLAERVKAATEAAEQAEKMVVEIEDANDVTERLVLLVAHVRDWQRGLVSDEELASAATLALDGLEEYLAPEVQAMVRQLL